MHDVWILLFVLAVGQAAVGLRAFRRPEVGSLTAFATGIVVAFYAMAYLVGGR